MKLSKIFEETPIHWGLRGDPFLWRELKERFKNIEMPDTPEQLKTLLEKEFEESTGYPVTHAKHFGVERFRSHGMSSGSISPQFWFNTALPLLVRRHAKP